MDVICSARYIELKKYFEKLDEIFKESISPILYPEVNEKLQSLEGTARKSVI